MKLTPLWILLFCLLLTAYIRAGEITLAWDDPQPGVVYRLEYARVATPDVWTVGAANIPKFIPNPDAVGPPIPEGYQQGTIPNIAPGEYHFRCFAVEPFSGLDSLPSETLTTFVRPTAPGKPRVKTVLQSSADLKEWRDEFVKVEVPEGNRFWRTVVAMVD